MVSFLSRMPVGIAGDITRAQHSTVESYQIDSGTPPTAFGQFVALVSGKLQPATAVASIIGNLVRPYPLQNQSLATQGLGAGTPPTSGIADVQRRGYMTVVAKGATAVLKGAAVYMVTTAGGSYAVGDIVTGAAPGSGSVGTLVPGATFEGPADANGNVEIAYNI